MSKDSSRTGQDRRSGKDRRQYTFTLHIPERRSGNDRRSPEGQKEKSRTSSSKKGSKSTTVNRPKIRKPKRDR